MQLVDAQPYYKTEPQVASTAKPSKDNVKRNNQLQGQEKVPVGATKLHQYRTDERRQLEADKAKEKKEQNNEKLKKIDTEKSQSTLAESADRATRAVVPPIVYAALPSREVLEKLTKLKLKLVPSAEEKAELGRQKAAILAAPNELVRPGLKYDFLILTGGASHGAYQAGVVCGWSDSGTMPEFAVVTGVSAGAIMAAAVFPGSDYLPEVRQLYTSVTQKSLTHGDLWTRKKFPHPFGIGTDSVASTEKIRGIFRKVLDSPGYFEKVAAEHAKGRRLYIGTTNLDTQRFVSWDMGAIASEGTPESRKLYEDILVGSLAIPPLLAPSRITMTIDGKQYEEMHVDGGVTRNLFFYPPSDWPGEEEDRKTGYRMLAGGRVYVVVAGKVYNDPEGTNPTLVGVGMRVVGSLLNSLLRAELFRVYVHCLDRDMAIKIAAIPEDYNPTPSGYEYDPEKLTKLFCEGYTRIQSNTAWNEDPPEHTVSEDRVRRSTVLTSTPSKEFGPLTPVRPAPLVPQRPGRP